MKRLFLLLSSVLLLVGCAHYRDTGGTSTPYDTEQGVGSRDYPVNDLNDLGSRPDIDNQRPDGQHRVPGRGVDINEGPL
jgi:hypothetical protein